MDPGTSVPLHFTDIETCCLYITEVAERMDTDQYYVTTIKWDTVKNNTLIINNK